MSCRRARCRQLTEIGVDVRTGVTVTDIDDERCRDHRRFDPARTVVWGAGNEASPLAARLGARRSTVPGGSRSATTWPCGGHPNVFAIGDMARAASDGTTVPGVAQGAIQGGRHVARAIRADLAGTPRPAFRYRNKGELATIGRSSAVGVIAGRQLSGWVAWMAWWSVHIFFLIDFRSRLLVLINWAWNYLTFRRGARLITGPWRPRNTA